MQNVKIHSPEEEKGLQYIMRQKIRTIMEIPTKDQIYDNVSFKLGAFMKRFWENRPDDLFKMNTRKAGHILALAENMQQISRQDDRLIKICAYSRQITKFQAKNYHLWKQYIWIDLAKEEKKMMEEYVQQLTPPAPLPGESKDKYLERSKKHMFSSYGKMSKGMLLVEVFEKIWTIKKYRQDEKFDDEKRHKKLTKQILLRFKELHPNLRGHWSNSLGYEEWNQIEQLW